MTAQEERKLDELRRECQDEEGHVDEDMAFRLWLRWKALTDLYFLGAEILGWRNSVSKNRKRRRVDAKLHGWLCALLQQDKDSLILIPRLHLKSTWVKLRIVQLILRDPNVRILLMSVTGRLVQSHLRDIKEWLASPVILELFPELPHPGENYSGWEKSTASELIVKRFLERGNMPSGPQILAVGMGARIVGFHADYAFLDDIIDDSTVTTAEQMMKSRTFWALLQPILETDAVVVITGTRYHPNDLYYTIIREKHFDSKRVFVRTCRERDKDGNPQPIYASWYSHEDLIRLERRMGAYLFNCQMNNDPSPMSDRVFPSPQPVYQVLPAQKAAKPYRYFLTVDPAPTTTEYSDYTGLAVGALNEANFLFVERGIKAKLSPEALCHRIIHLHTIFRFEKIGIELGLQEALKPLLRRVIADWEAANHRSLGLSIDGNVIGIKISKEQKARRITATFGAAIREGKAQVRFDQGDLITQMDTYFGRGDEEDDIIDACSLLYQLIPTYSASYEQPRHLRKGRTIMDFKRKRSVGWWKQFTSGRVA